MILYNKQQMLYMQHLVTSQADFDAVCILCDAYNEIEMSFIRWIPILNRKYLAAQKTLSAAIEMLKKSGNLIEWDDILEGCTCHRCMRKRDWGPCLRNPY